MRIAIIADIHGNIPALEAVCADIAAQAVDEVLVAGDLVGRGPQGTATVERIADKGWPCIRGNHEDYLLNFVHRRVPDEWMRTDIWSCSRWMAEELSPDAIAYMEALPLTLHSQRQPSLLMVHGTPDSNNMGIGDWTTQAKRQGYLDTLTHRGANLLVCAHTHRPYHGDFPLGTIVNVGSVGMPFNGDPRAQYAIFETADSGQSWQVHFRQVAYDREEILGIYRDTGFLEAGGITAALLQLELEQARPFLTPFLKWSQHFQVEPTALEFERFRQDYDETQPMALFLQLRTTGSPS